MCESRVTARRRVDRLSLAIAIPVAALLVGAATSDEQGPHRLAPEAQRIGCWSVARNAQLELRAWARGTAAPLELRIAREAQTSARGCATREQFPRGRLPAVGDQLPAPLRIEPAAVHEWHRAFTALHGSTDSTRWAQSHPPRLTLRGVGGDLSIVPLPQRSDVRDSARLFLTVGARAYSTTLSAAEVWWLGWAMTEQAKVLDPGGDVDASATYFAPQVDQPPVVLRASSCSRPFLPRPSIVSERLETLEVDFVVDSTGRVDPAEITFGRYWGRYPENVRRYRLLLLACLGDVEFRPAILRDHRVRMHVRHEFWLSSSPNTTQATIL
jgi:hypothetical protein